MKRCPKCNCHILCESQYVKTGWWAIHCYKCKYESAPMPFLWLARIAWNLSGRSKKRMKKYCAHCGASVEGRGCITLDFGDTFYDSRKFKHVGVGEVLCVNCADSRARLHAELDMDFLHINKKVDKNES